jgi:ankyrin repeat protein
MGSFILVYSGWTFAGQNCDMDSCRYAKTSVVEAKYSLPRWPLDVSILASFKISHGLPAAGLSVQRRISRRGNPYTIIGLSKMGSTEGARSLLARRPDAVLDVSEHEGKTALDNAIRYRHIDTAKVLIAAGADPMAENDFGFPAIALVLLYKNHRSKALQQEFEDLLPLSTFYEECEFSHLHKVVLGVRPLDLKVQLNRDVSRSQLNQKDKMGLTPLYWAASQGNTFAVHLLLQAGADINIVDNGGNTPLHMACRAGSRTCTEALIIAGADIHKRLPNGYQCIHLAAMAMHGIDLLECILSHRAPVNDSQNSWKVTPLALATLYGRADNCKYLLEHGAGVDNSDWEGNTPIFGAIRHTRSTKFLSLFLSKNCNYLHQNFEGQTILHLLALYGRLGC